MKMTSWYDIYSLGGVQPSSIEEMRKNFNYDEVSDSVNIVKRLIEQETALLGGNTDKVFIGGFSQGCAIALATFLALEKSVGAVVGLSGANLIDLKKEGAVTDIEGKKKIPMMLYHGLNDPVIAEKEANLSY
jgi:phospholipase/carboxylesterase